MSAFEVISSRLDRLAGKRAAPVSTGARESLKAAHDARDRAQRAYEAASAATGRARALLESIVRHGEALDAVELRAAEALADRFRDSIAAGAAPTFSGDREMANVTAQRTALDGHRRAAERVVAELAAAEHEREREASDAVAAVEKAVQDVLRGEVEKIAADWQAADLAARKVRVRLGVQGNPAWRLAGDSDAGRRATYQNREDAEFDLRQRQIAADPWIEFAAGLVRDADTRLDFTASDLAIEQLSKERAEKREADERYLADMRGAA